MDFSKLNQNERLATFGAIAVVIGGLVGYSYGFTLVAVLAAIGMLAVIFMPQMSPNTSLPGSRGSLMLLFGAIAAVILVLALLLYIGIVFVAFNVRDLFFLIAVVGGVVMAWAAWQELQSEGGKFRLGGAPSSAASSTAAPMGSATAPPAEPAEPATSETTASAEATTAAPETYEAPRATEPMSTTGPSASADEPAMPADDDERRDEV